VSADFSKESFSLPTNLRVNRILIVGAGNSKEESRLGATKLDRIHRCGAALEDFAGAVRQQSAPGSTSWKSCPRRKIPFVNHETFPSGASPGFRDGASVPQAIPAPYDDIACARGVAAPAWHLEVAGFGALPRVGRKGRRMPSTTFCKVPQGKLLSTRSQAALRQSGGICFLFAEKNLKAFTARDILGASDGGWEIPQRREGTDRKSSRALVEIHERSGTRKAKRFAWRSFSQYLELLRSGWREWLAWKTTRR